MTRVLIVDDEPQILRALRITLQARHFEVITAAGGAEALRLVSSEHPDLVLLDLGLPDLDGVEVIRRLRAWTQIPIVILSGRMNSTDKVEALDAGADDYVTKPFSIDELLARVRAVSRRLVGAEPPAPVRIGRFAIDLVEHRVAFLDSSVGPDAEPDASKPADVTDSAVHLTPIEWHLLTVLARNPGRLVSQRQLLTEVWGPTYVNEGHYLRQYLKHLRRKLEDDPARPRHLITEPGLGYRFQP